MNPKPPPSSETKDENNNLVEVMELKPASSVVSVASTGPESIQMAGIVSPESVASISEMIDQPEVDDRAKSGCSDVIFVGRRKFLGREIVGGF